MYAEGSVVSQLACYLETVAYIRPTAAFVNFAAIKGQNTSPNDDEEHDVTEQTMVDHFPRRHDFHNPYNIPSTNSKNLFIYRIITLLMQCAFDSCFLS